MIGHIYRDVILEQHVCLFRGAMWAEFLFMDDNARPHRANIVDECLHSEDITRMDWPAYSSDLNPTEHVWDMLGRRIAARQPPPLCLPELRRALLDGKQNNARVVTPHMDIIYHQTSGLEEFAGIECGQLNKCGKFTEDCVPDGVFPFGDDVFVFSSTYYDSASVHIRRFKKYGKTYYPTPEGITLDPRWIEYIMRKKKVPESLEELPSGLFPPERHIQITSENFIDFTFKRIKYSPDKEPTFKEITIAREQWAEMIEKYGAIENAIL
ncbi:transposable element Tcb1 transposase [Trichonephila clavipes]|uniref:Transposable element Tcb1 transposase n=1 Tax=Trichonephila clavipes TaxID=2585209 RepID=A0A8X6RPQ6_TRICX|nr:transposable element Tcb1 transposase [Trichonephila clavipes]